MLVNGVKILFMLDTGAKVTLLSYSLFRTSFNDIQLRDTTEIPWLKIRGSNGLTLPFQGYVVLDFQIGDIELKGKGVLIVKDVCFGTQYGLLGMNVISEIWKFVSSVDNLEGELDNLQSLTNALPDPKHVETEVPEEHLRKRKDSTWKRVRHFLGLRKPQRWEKPKDPAASSTSYQEDNQGYEGQRPSMRQCVDILPTTTCKTRTFLFSSATAGPLASDAKNVPDKPSFVGFHPMVEMVVNRVRIPFMLDTGSPVTLLSHSLFQQSFQDIQMKDISDITWLKLEAANGLEIPYQGYVVLDFQIGGIEIMGKAVLIVKDEDCCRTQRGVLGMNVLSDILKPVSTLEKLLRDLDKLQSLQNSPP
ncbi:hypothetical protein F2P81_022524 [Scophthalmus maximus]|uniref:Peptidase A2 domain-containing protein n=1 Tax=Scophthalmus maximus TaxID=52904 RepID=A0A6A4RUH4_SCOMX|nr:hypothetical protein F2P81_022524 [Scophthalmus maximus]